MAELLTTEELNEALERLENWRLLDGKLHREFRFRNFIEAFGFMTRAAIEAEKMNHHPEWSNVYSRVMVNLTTHDADGITSLDTRLATIMDELAGD